jgi:methylmalonyl-CoA mutase
MKTNPPSNAKPLRILTAVPICDGHDSAIITVNLDLVRQGLEVIYLGYHRSVSDVVRAAIQEDVGAIGLSSYNGGHVEFFSEVLGQLRRRKAPHIGLFGGGGGTITSADARLMKQRGVDEIFFAGTPLAEIVEWVKRTYGKRKRRLAIPEWRSSRITDLELGKLLSGIEAHPGNRRLKPQKASGGCPVIGITGPGGAGKTTLIDELVLRFLNRSASGRLAILSHDPASASKGALLGDRATMIYAQDDRVFMRSLATDGESRGLSAATQSCLALLKQAGFDLVLVESAGIGQESLPFQRGLVDKQILVMSPEYGGRLQLHKLAMLEAADVVVVNKSDLPAARTANSEINQRLAMNQRGQKVIATVAKHHRDPGVDQLFREVIS